LIYTSDLPNDQDMIKALGSTAIPVNLFTDACFSSVDDKVVAVERKKVGDMASCVLDTDAIPRTACWKSRSGFLS